MRYHNSSACPSLNKNGRLEATEYPDVSSDFSRMATGITKPESVAGKLYDAARGRLKHPLGPWAKVSTELADAGASYFYLGQPATRFLAHLRRRCTGKMPADMRLAQIELKRQCDEAEAEGLKISLTVSSPAASDLLAFQKEATDAILALEKAKEIAEDELAELEAK